MSNLEVPKPGSNKKWSLEEEDDDEDAADDSGKNEEENVRHH